jgi:hypothetical protein
MTEHEENMRDLAAMFVMNGLIINGDYSLEAIPSLAYKTADNFMDERNRNTDDGIAAITPKRKYERRQKD